MQSHVFETAFFCIFCFTHKSFGDIIDIVDYLPDITEYSLLPPVAQLDNAVDSDSKDRGFESLRAGHDCATIKHKSLKPLNNQGFFAVLGVNFKTKFQGIKLNKMFDRRCLNQVSSYTSCSEFIFLMQKTMSTSLP